MKITTASIERVLALQEKVKRLEQGYFNSNDNAVEYLGKLYGQEIPLNTTLLTRYLSASSNAEKVFRDARKRLVNAQIALLRGLRIPLPERYTGVSIVYQEGKSVLGVRYKDLEQNQVRQYLIRVRGFDVIKSTTNAQ